jgi:hypothetical protein
VSSHGSGAVGAMPTLQALVDGGGGDVPLINLRFRCSNCSSGKGSTSFSVRNNRYRWLACGENGDAISFAMWVWPDRSARQGRSIR